MGVALLCVMVRTVGDVDDEVGVADDVGVGVGERVVDDGVERAALDVDNGATDRGVDTALLLDTALCATGWPTMNVGAELCVATPDEMVVPLVAGNAPPPRGPEETPCASVKESLGCEKRDASDSPPCFARAWR
jgi:hypothetical protein